MIHTYTSLYGICFIATVIIIVLLLWIGTEIESEEAQKRGKEIEPQSTKQWIMYILKAFLIAFIVSFVAPLTLIFYILMIGCVIIAAFDD